MSQLSEQPAGTSVPTSADVARLAGVSRATVSYVLNDNTSVRISEPTRRRVREAAADLGYVPHAAARSLRAGHTRMVLLPAARSPAGPLYQRFLTGLETGLRRLDYTVVQYGSAGMDADEAARAWAELRPVAVVSPGNIALTPYGTGVLTRSGAKAVITLGPQPVEGAHALVVDQREVGGAAVRHLLSRGRRGIGVVMPQEPGPPPSPNPGWPERYAPWRSPARTPVSGHCPCGTRRSRRRTSPPAGGRWAWTPCSRTTTSTPCC